MNDVMRAPSTSAHWTRPAGYIKGRWNGPVCGIADKVDGWRSYSLDEQKHLVTCEWCLYWLWEQDQPAKKLDLTATEDRVVNMRFDNRGMSAHDTEKAIAEGVEKGIKAGLDKVRSDFFESDAVGNMLRVLVKQSMRDVLAEATVRANQRVLFKEAFRAVLSEAQVRSSLVGLHKRAEAELLEDYENSPEQKQDDLQWEIDIKRVLTEVLEERAEDGKDAVQFTQNVYAPAALSPNEIYRASFLGETSRPGMEINVVAEVDPKEFAEMTKKAVTEAADEWNDEHPEKTLEDERLNIQRAMGAMMELPGFKRRFKDLVKQAIDEEQAENDEEYADWHKDIINNVLDERIVTEHKAKLAWQQSRLGRTLNLTDDTLNNLGDIVESFANRPILDMVVQLPQEPKVHYRRLYHTEPACGAPTDSAKSIFQNSVTCDDCRTTFNN